MARLDAHQHFWRYDPQRYGWIGPGMEALARDFGPADLEPLLSAAGLEGSILVQARQDLEEIDELLALADGHPFVRGVVGWLDLASPDFARQLERYGAHPRLFGLRHILQGEPDDRHMLTPAFRAGIGRLAQHGLVYDLLLHPRHLPIALELVDAYPAQPFVLDHLAKPFIARGELEPWARDLKELARRPHVSAKISGLVTEAIWDAWQPEQLWPYLDVALEAFGPSRLLYGSDWPVCLLAGSYAEVHAVNDRWSGKLSPSERAALFGDNAGRIYSISN
jgi:L-fuconolactonase